jgi:hypothetical protein
MQSGTEITHKYLLANQDSISSKLVLECGDKSRSEATKLGTNFTYDHRKLQMEYFVLKTKILEETQPILMFVIVEIEMERPRRNQEESRKVRDEDPKVEPFSGPAAPQGR